MEVVDYKTLLRNWAINYGLFCGIGLLMGVLQLYTDFFFSNHVGFICFFLIYLIHNRRYCEKHKSFIWIEPVVVFFVIFLFFLFNGTNHDSPDSAAVLSYVTDAFPSVEKFSYFSTIWGSSYYLMAVGYGSDLFVLLWRFFQIYTCTYWLFATFLILFNKRELKTLVTSGIFLSYILSPMYLRHSFAFQTNIASAQMLMAILILGGLKTCNYRRVGMFDSILLGFLLVSFCFVRIDTLILIIPVIIYLFLNKDAFKSTLLIYSVMSIVIILLFLQGQFFLGGLTYIYNNVIFGCLMSSGLAAALLVTFSGRTLSAVIRKYFDIILSCGVLRWILFVSFVLVLLSLNVKRDDGLYNFMYNTFSYKSLRRSWGLFYFGILVIASVALLQKKLISKESLLAFSIFFLTLMIAGGRRIGEGDSLNRMMLTVGVACLFPFLKEKLNAEE